MKINITNIDSSIIKSVTYDYQKLELQIEFAGEAKYRYSDVGNHFVIDFLEAESKGKYINSIKNNYECEKVESNGTSGQPSVLI